MHLHSKYSRAVSPQMLPKNMAAWAKVKGVNLIAAADFTHPIWLQQLKEELVEAGEGIYKLKKKENDVLFIISGEISSIYSQGGKTRRIHNLVFVPNFKITDKINSALKKRGANLFSDGRPIIGLSALELADLVFNIDPDCLIIPAHIWSPWFSLFGSRSGFDSLKECFGKFAQNIYAIETGISSDPAMNWRVEELENLSIVSFSDAHSLPKIGREATVFKVRGKKNLSFAYQDLISAIKKERKSDWYVSSTIEFYPEEGRYHFDGHRKCKIRRSPQETRKKGAVCPICGKPLTLGVAYRVSQLSIRKINPVKKEIKGLAVQSHPREEQPPYITLVPLLEIIAEVKEKGVNTKGVKEAYDQMIKSLGSELDILLQSPLEKINSLFGKKMREGIEKNRKGEITIEPGFDGQYGTVKIWEKEEKDLGEKQASLF